MTGARRQEILFGAVLLLSIPLLALSGEAILRLKHTQLDFDWGKLRHDVGVEDEDMQSHRFKPGSNYGKLSFNSLGFRGPEPEAPKPEGRKRIAVLGSSTVLGVELEEHDSLPAKLVVYLSQFLPGCRFDYISVSGPSYSPADIAVVLGTLPDWVQPDLYIYLTSPTDGTASDAAPGDHDLGIPAKLAAKSLLYAAVKGKFDAWRKRRSIPGDAIDPPALPIVRDISGIAAVVGNVPLLEFWHLGQNPDPLMLSEIEAADSPEIVIAPEDSGRAYVSLWHLSRYGADLAARHIATSIVARQILTDCSLAPQGN